MAIYNIKLRVDSLRELDKRKEYILSVIDGSGSLTPELKAKIENTLDSSVLEDLYLPYKPKRRTRATMARDKGLEPLAKIIMAQNTPSLKQQASRYINDDVITADDAIAGASDIIAEWVSESEKSRNIVRARYLRTATISAKVIPGKEAEAQNYQNYFNFSEPLRVCSSHRYLALRRAEADGNEITERLGRLFIKHGASAECAQCIRNAISDGYKRLIRPSIESEVSALTKEKADKTAIDMFAGNVRQLLLAPPLFNQRVLAIDPGFRTGCKIVCLDQQGNLLAHDVIYPCAPANDYHGSAYKIGYLVDRYGIDAIAVGTGTAGRETERFLSSLRYPHPVQIFMVNEDGASVYSASETARSGRDSARSRIHRTPTN